MLYSSMTNRRFVLVGLTLIAFFISILEPVPRSNGIRNSYSSVRSSFEGIPDVPLDLGANQEFCKAFYDINVKMDMEFTVIATKLSKRNTNIFQTDDLNTGLRIEISPDGKLNAFVQSPDGGGPEKVLSVLAYDVVRVNKLAKINVSVHSGSLSLQIDDGPVASQEGNFRPTCNHVLIGGGYDSSRSTIGGVQAVVQIQDLKLGTTFGMPMRIRDVARILFTILILSLTWEYRRELSDSINKVTEE